MVKSHNKKFLLTILAAILLVSLACNIPAPDQAMPKGSPAPATLTSQAVEAFITLQMISTQTAIASSVASTQQITMSPTILMSSETPVATPTNQATEMCSDKAEFVEDVSVPDGSLFLPGEVFTKTWRLRNAGTCAWTTQYQLVLTGGDPMSSKSGLPLAGFVIPGSTVDLSVGLAAPNANGEYKGSWMIRSNDGKNFGIGKEANTPFWVKIIVAQAAEDQDLGAPTWIDTFKNGNNWFLLETDYTEFKVKNDQLVMRASPGGGDEWGLANVTMLKDFYLEVTFKTGESCSGLDRYGILVRAPNPNSGYVFGFSCDGNYRIYKWDGTNYVALQVWKKSALIHAGVNQTNRLGFRGEGEQIKLYANGKLLGEFTDDTYKAGRFGLFIGSINTDNLEVFVEDIAYWELGG